MKKSLFFAGMLVIASVLATSCKPKVEAPKANFDYEANGLEVTFTNLSKGDGTLTYAWEFGDGAQSTEAAPKHTYAEAGEYDVTLTATNEGGSNKKTNKVSLTAPAPIKVDGVFDDWDKVDKAILAESVLGANPKHENLFKVRFCTDADYIYFYAEYNAEAVGPLDMMWNFDDDETTGQNTGTIWEPSGLEVLFEGSPAPVDDPEWPSDGYKDAGIYTYAGDGSSWNWDDTETTGAIAACLPVALSNGHTAIEGSIMRAMLPATPKVCKVGVFTSDASWSESGALPQTTINDDGTETKSGLLEVKLN